MLFARAPVKDKRSTGDIRVEEKPGLFQDVSSRLNKDVSAILYYGITIVPFQHFVVLEVT